MLGDTVEQALSAVGVTQQRVERWLGRCCCQERRDRLNRISAWALRILAGKLSNASPYLDSILEDE